MVKLALTGMGDMTKEPCCECGKTRRQDFHGYCMDCADENGISDLFPEEERQRNLELLSRRPFMPYEKEANLKRMQQLMTEKLAKEGIDPKDFDVPTILAKND